MFLSYHGDAEIGALDGKSFSTTRLFVSVAGWQAIHVGRYKDISMLQIMFPRLSLFVVLPSKQSSAAYQWLAGKLYIRY